MYQVDESGFYGEFGGAYIPEILYSNVENLKKNYLEIMERPDFKEEFYRLMQDYVGRPSPLYFASRLSEKYDCNIYLKREDLNHTGAHKINNTIGQILIAKRLGKTRIIAETGAGQHGVATATVCALMNMRCVVYMGKIDMERQYLNVQKMQMLGAEVRAVSTGSMTLKDATSEAIRDWCCNPEDTYYIIGSTVGPHPYPDMVARFQSVISQEMRLQLQEKEGRDYPDYVIACIGGGSNAAGAFYHFLEEKRTKLVAVEASGKGVDSPLTAASILFGELGILHGSKIMLLQDENGQVQEAYSISAGLDYPGVGPMHCHLHQTGRSIVTNANDREALDAALELTRLEGIIPALESSHALAALAKIKFQKDDVVVINLSGRGDKDMPTYIDNFDNK